MARVNGGGVFRHVQVLFYRIAIEPVQAALRTNPYVAIFILAKTTNGAVVQAFGRCQAPKGRHLCTCQKTVGKKYKKG